MPSQGVSLEIPEESKLYVVYQHIDQLHSNPNNARTHSKRQLRQIGESIREFGFTNPVIVDAENRIVAGHGRVAAAKRLGITTVPTIRLDGLTKEQIRAYMIADNKLAQNAGWDREILAIEFQELFALDCVDITVTGFETTEIDLILEEAKTARRRRGDCRSLNSTRNRLQSPAISGSWASTG